MKIILPKYKFPKLKEIPKLIGDSRIYKIWLSPLISVLYSAFGNTVGIWAGYILIEGIFVGIWEGWEWPGIDSIINDGVLLVISFSFLTIVLYQSTRRMKINVFNVLSSAFLVIVSAYYIRAIALEQSGIGESNDSIIYAMSLIAFFSSLILLYISLVWQKYIQFEGDARKNRNIDYEDLKDQLA